MAGENLSGLFAALLLCWKKDKTNFVCSELGINTLYSFFHIHSSIMIESLYTWLSHFLNWRSCLIIFVLMNLKSIPLSWHLRALYHFLRHHPGKPYSDASPVTSSDVKPQSTPAATKLLFGTVTITTRSPMLEADFNWHKSNSTYFSDLDISRLVLMTRVYFGGFSVISRELASEGHTGRMSFTLGSVYCSFRRPLRPYDSYAVSSKVLAWDRKWLYIISWFEPKGRSGVIATAVSKYVCKKGRFTVPPERLLRASGLLPSKGHFARSDVNKKSGERTKGARTTEEPQCEKGGERMASVISKGEEQWESEIETERVRGLESVKSFIDLDDISFSEVAKILQS
jgi:hypothetical protein